MRNQVKRQQWKLFETSGRLLQRLSSLGRHLAFERCARFLEQQSPFDLAKLKYAARMQESMGTIPKMKYEERHEFAGIVSKVEKGWALKEENKVNIGQLQAGKRTRRQ